MASTKIRGALGRPVETVEVDPETVSYIRTINAASLLLIQAGANRTQQEEALRMIIDASNEELIRRGIEDKSHNRLPDSRG